MMSHEPTNRDPTRVQYFVVIDRGATILGPFLSHAEAVREARECRGHNEFVVMQFPALAGPVPEE